MKNFALTFLLTLATSVGAIQAQEVVSLAKSPHIQDGLYVDPQGMVYTTCGGLVNRTTIGIYDPKTEVFEVLTNDMRGSIDIASDGGRYLYVTNYDDNTIKRFDKETKETIDWATGLDGPAGIEMDKEGNLYVTSFGAPPAYSGNTIWKIDSEGNKEKVFSGEVLYRPQGMGWYNDHKLVVSNSGNGGLFLFDVNTREISEFANTGLPHGNIAIGRGKIYLASNRTHKLLEINMEGDIVNTFGTGQALTKDGALAEAAFVNPLGLAFSHDEKRLYISQIQDGSLRCIVFER